MVLFSFSKGSLRNRHSQDPCQTCPQHCRSPVLLISQTRWPRWGNLPRATQLERDRGQGMASQSLVPDFACLSGHSYQPGVGLVSQGCCINRVPHTGWLKTTEIHSLQFWRPEDWNEGVNKVMFPVRLWVESFLASSWLLVVAGNLWHALTSSCITLISASVITWCPLLGLHIILPGHQLYWIRGYPTLVWLHLNWWYLQWPYFQIRS